METMTYYERDTEYQSLRKFLKRAEDADATAGLLALALREELTARQAQMVRMYYIEQHTMRDIAGILGVNISTVSRTLAAARKRLKRCLKYASRSLLRPDNMEDD